MIVAKLVLKKPLGEGRPELSLEGVDSPPSVSDIQEDEEILILKEHKTETETFYVLVTDRRIRVIREDLASALYTKTFEENFVTACDFQSGALLISLSQGQLLYFRIQTSGEFLEAGKL